MKEEEEKEKEEKEKEEEQQQQQEEEDKEEKEEGILRRSVLGRLTEHLVYHTIRNTFDIIFK